MLYSIFKQVVLAKYGESGENNIAFELKNSGMDMYILRDIYLEKDEMPAQIDYIVITRKHLYVIECKNLIGNIEIDSNGAFVRSYELFGIKVKEGIYSPITQNERHLLVLKEVRKDSKKNMFSKIMYEKYFKNTHRAIVVLANPKTYLNMKYAKKEIKNQVIRADQLITYIREEDAKEKDYSWSNDDMLEVAEFYLSYNKKERSDYSKRYREMLNIVEENEKVPKTLEDEAQIAEENTQKKIRQMNRENCVKLLKKYRLEQSRKEGVKPYYIFNDAQMEKLLEKVPENKEELLEVSGFGKVKVEKYGDAIIAILKENGEI